jgi:hypothetical protein
MVCVSRPCCRPDKTCRREHSDIKQNGVSDERGRSRPDGEVRVDDHRFVVEPDREGRGGEQGTRGHLQGDEHGAGADES